MSISFSPYFAEQREHREQLARYRLGLEPRKPEPFLRRSEVTAKLQAAGYPVGKRTLAILAANGEGPRFRGFRRVPLYCWDEVLEWAEANLVEFGDQRSEQTIHEVREPKYG
jgi:hypothetical protein